MQCCTITSIGQIVQTELFSFQKESLFISYITRITISYANDSFKPYHTTSLHWIVKKKIHTKSKSKYHSLQQNQTMPFRNIILKLNASS